MSIFDFETTVAVERGSQWQLEPIAVLRRIDDLRFPKSKQMDGNNATVHL